jgi:hypothetical protein
MTTDDRHTIESFQFLDAEIDLPVDPDDIAQLERAHQWSKREYSRYDREYRTAMAIPEMYSSNAIPTDRSERDYLGAFHAALARTLHTMRQKDQDLLAAWNNGEPIKTEEEAHS